MQISSKKIQEKHSTDSVVSLLANRYSRTIIMVTQKKPKSAMEISEEHNFPMGSVYRSINFLSDNGFLIKTGSLNVRGRKYFQYRSTIKSILLKLDSGSFDFVTTTNNDLEEDNLDVV